MMSASEFSAARQPLFEPSVEWVSATQLTAFIRFCEQRSGRVFPTYSLFERFCIDESRAFWLLFLEWSRLIWEGEQSPVITSDRCEQARFFPRLRLNYVENLLRIDGDDVAASRPALTAVHLDRPTERWSRAELRYRVNALAAALQSLGLGPGSRVALVAHNTTSAIV